MQKLTLSVDGRVVERAKRYARAQGTSVSALVEKMLDAVAASAARRDGMPPILQRLRGSLKRGSVSGYHRYVERKYR